MRTAHAAHFLALAEEAASRLLDQEQEAWLTRLELEHDNLRAVLSWARAREAGRVIGLRVTVALWRFWSVRGHLSEGRTWLDAFLGQHQASVADSAIAAARVKALRGAGILARNQGDYAQAQKLLDESLALSRAAGDRRGIASALNSQGLMVWEQGNYERAREMFNESLSVERALGNKTGIASVLNNLGLLAWKQGDYAQAQELFTQSLGLEREVGNKGGIAISLENLGNVVQEQGDYGRARVLREESLVLYRELGDKAGMASALNNLGTVAQEQSDYARARQPLEESLALLEELGDRRGFARTLHNLGTVVHEQGDVAQARSLIEKSLVLRRELGDTEGMGRALLELGIVAEEQGDVGGAFPLIAQSLALRQEMSDRRGIAECLEALAHLAIAPESSSELMERAVRLLGAAGVLRTTLGAPLVPAEQTRHDCAIATLRASRLSERTTWTPFFAFRWPGVVRNQPYRPRYSPVVRAFPSENGSLRQAASIGERAYASARAKGQALSLEQAVAGALGMIPGEDSLTARPPLPRQLVQ